MKDLAHCWYLTRVCSHCTTRDAECCILPNFTVRLQYCVHILCNARGQSTFMGITIFILVMNSTGICTQCQGSRKGLISSRSATIAFATTHNGFTSYYIPCDNQRWVTTKYMEYTDRILCYNCYQLQLDHR